jgi:cell division protein ZapA (FtsZ GTPase activity inhibitor)
LDCRYNQIVSLDLSENVNLAVINCSNNQLASLDISALLNLNVMFCCNQSEGFILHLTNEQKNEFTEKNYCNAKLEIK